MIRGGGGILYVGQYDQATPILANIGFSIRSDVVSPDGGRTPAFLLKDGLPPASLPSNDLLVPGYGAVPVGQNPTLAVEFFEPQGRAVPYLYNFNLNVQRQLPGNTVFEIAYLSTLGHKLTAPGSRSINQVDAGPYRSRQHSSAPPVSAVLGRARHRADDRKFELSRAQSSPGEALLARPSVQRQLHVV